MTREPSFNAPTSEHTLKDLQETIEHALLRSSEFAIGRDPPAKSLTIAIDMHIRQLIKETKHD